MTDSVKAGPPQNSPIRVGFVLHVMQVAGAEVLVAETIRRLGPRITPVIFCLDAVGALGEEMLRAGIPVLSFKRRPGIDWQCATRMSSEIRSRNLDVLHCHQYTPFFYGALAARLARTGTKVIFTEHGRHYPDVVSSKRRLVNRLFLRHLADRITSVCEFSGQALAEKDGFPSNRIEVVENGIDLERYAAPMDRAALRHRLGLDPARRYIACIARFHPVKDHRMLLDAFAQIAPDLPDVDLLLVGDGPLRPDLEAQAASLGVAPRVRFFGVRPDVPDILAAVDVFALTSVSEAASITLLEAMASGLPVVVTDVGGNPEIVRAGIDGLLVPRGDAGALSEALRRVLSHSTLGRTMGTEGAARVRERYQLDSTIERYGSMYSTLRAERAGRGA